MATSVWLVGRSVGRLDVMSEDFNLFRIRASPEEKMVIGCLLPMFCSPPRADSTTVSQLVRWFSLGYSVRPNVVVLMRNFPNNVDDDED